MKKLIGLSLVLLAALLSSCEETTGSDIRARSTSKHQIFYTRDEATNLCFAWTEYSWALGLQAGVYSFSFTNVPCTEAVKAKLGSMP